MRIELVGCVLILSSAMLACGGGGNMEWKGTLKGTFQLKDFKNSTSSAYPRPAPLEEGKGSAMLYTGLVDHFRLGSDTPIPDCTFEVEKSGAVDTTRLDFKIKNPEKSHTGETNDGKGCQGRVEKGGELVAIQILAASVELHSSGEIHVSIDYVPTDRDSSTSRDPLRLPQPDYEKRRDLYMDGERGWF